MITESGMGKAPGLDDLPYDLYKIMPDLFRHLLAEVYMKWQQNEFILRSLYWGVVTLVRKDPTKKDIIDTFWPVSLLNTELKILTKVLLKRLARVTEGSVGEAQTCALSGRTIQDNLHNIRHLMRH